MSHFGKGEELLPYDFKEKIIPAGNERRHAIYDRSFLNELSNIESHGNALGYKGNTVHYIISGRSVEAAGDMVQTLMQSLFRAKRISSRRMEIISEIEPDIYKKNCQMEKVLENNYGGVVVIDLSEKFGFEPVDYVRTSQYLERLFKKYRNHCLFVFTYNMAHPGFSYQLLPQIKKYAIPVMLREGKGDRKAAVTYMRSLIEGSEYAEYAFQAGEFMELFQGDVFTQTDVLTAYEQFEPWCMNKNVLKAYHYDFSEGFLSDRDETEKSSYERLNQMVGLKIVKEQIEGILASDIIEKERKRRGEKDYQPGTMHMIFGGNPGSAKTTVAKLFAGIAKEKGILKSGAFVERGGMDLNGLGCVCEIREAFLAAKGGVLFIDEAYALCDGYKNGYGDEAINTLVQEMENHREDVIVIFAGYPEPMKEFLDRNPGMLSRIAFQVEFEDYTTDELCDIARLMLSKKQMRITDAAMCKLRDGFGRARESSDYGNGRYVRKVLEEAEMNLAERLFQSGETDITTELLTTMEACDIPAWSERKRGRDCRIGFACS